MKTAKALMMILLMCLSLSVMAQQYSRVRIEQVKGQNSLVLKTGRTAPSDNPDIILKLDDNTWKMLDDLLAAPLGASSQLRDLSGYKVNVAHARVNTKDGLIFTSGTKSVSITKATLDELREDKEEKK